MVGSNPPAFTRYRADQSSSLEKSTFWIRVALDPGKGKYAEYCHRQFSNVRDAWVREGAGKHGVNIGFDSHPANKAGFPANGKMPYIHDRHNFDG